MRAVDFDGDKKTDLVASVALDGKGEELVVIKGGAGGKLGKPAAFGFACKRKLGFELAYRDKFVWQVADIDGDGTQELVVAPNGIAAVDFDRPHDAGSGNYGVCAVKLTKKLTFEKPQCSESTEAYPAQVVALADFNGDGQLDIATAPEQHSYMTTTQHLDVVMNAGKGMLENKRRPIKADTSALNAFWARDAGDVTGDGKADIIALGSRSGSSDTIALVLPGTGDGSFPTSFVATTSYEASANAAAVRFGAFQGRARSGSCSRHTKARRATSTCTADAARTDSSARCLRTNFRGPQASQGTYEAPAPRDTDGAVPVERSVALSYFLPSPSNVMIAPCTRTSRRR